MAVERGSRRVMQDVIGWQSGAHHLQPDQVEVFVDGPQTEADEELRGEMRGESRGCAFVSWRGEGDVVQRLPEGKPTQKESQRKPI